MLTWLAEFSGYLNALNVFRYITFRTGAATATAMFFVFMFGPWLITLLRLKQGKGQPIREDGPKSHLLTKKGTPTMGGLMILSGVLFSTLLWANLANPYVWVVLMVTCGFGLIGFYDDYLKVTKQSHKGFSGRSRLAIEAVIAGTACLVISHVGAPALASKLAVPFFKDLLIDLGWFFAVFGAFVIVAAGNAVNLTDGLDGLAIVPVMIAAATFGFIAYLSGNAIFANYLQIHFVPGTGELAIVCGALIGAGIGFLWFNAPPAQIFMGDTGALALGGLLGRPCGGDRQPQGDPVLHGCAAWLLRAGTADGAGHRRHHRAVGADPDGGKPGACPVSGPGPQALVQPGKRAAAQHHVGASADRRRTGDSLSLTTKSCAQGVTIPPQTAINRGQLSGFPSHG